MRKSTQQTTVTKAMLLAAGLGTRLKPLTNTTPKPMLPVDGRPLIDFALDTLRRGGIREVMINLHHLPDQIRGHVGDGNRHGLRAYYSAEPVILGTGGGVKACEQFFGSEPFCLMNADTLIDLDLRQLFAHHIAQGIVGTLVVRPLAPDDTYQPVGISPDGRLTGFGHGNHFYAGVQICTPALLDILPAGKPSCLIEHGLKPLLDSGARIATFLHTGRWNDIGTPERYTLATQQSWSTAARSGG